MSEHRIRPVRRTVAVAALGALALTGLLAAPAAPVSADPNPTITFSTTEVTVPFGGDWLVELRVAAPDTEYESTTTPDATWGTVDIRIDDVGGVYSAGLPIQRGGVVYFARPTDAPLLAAGEHHATATFRPAVTGFLEAQTPTPLTITVTPLGLEPRLEILDVPGDKATPYAVLDLVGEYVDALGTPAGSWALTVSRDGAQLLQSTSDVAAGDGPVNVSLAEYVKPGTTLTVDAVFTPDAAVAGGATLSETASQEIDTPALTPIEWLTRVIAVPWWLVVVGLVILAGAVVAALMVAVRYRRRSHDDTIVDSADGTSDDGSDAHENDRSAIDPADERP